MRRLCLVLLFMAAADATYTFQAGDDDVPRTWAMYFGGTGPDYGRAIATDAAGNSYVAGSTLSSAGLPASGIPTPGSYLLKFDSAGALQYAVPVGGTVYDVSTAPDGSAFVVASRALLADVYVMKVTSSGSTAYVTDIPGLTMSAPHLERPAIAAGPRGNVAVAGRTVSGSFGVPPSTVGPAGGEDVAVVMLDPRGAITSVTVIGGTGADAAADVAMDASGSLYVAGRTSSENFPVTRLAVRSPSGGCTYPGTAWCENAFVVKLDALGGLVSATYYGGSGDDRAVAIGVDRTGGVYVTGATASPDFPVVRAVQSTNRLCRAQSAQPNFSCNAVGFVVRFDRDLSSVAFSTHLGGTWMTFVYGMSVDPSGNAYVVGMTRGNDFPVRRAPQPDNAAGPIVLTRDDGRTWLGASGLRANSVYAVAWSTEARPVAYAATDRGLFVSTDSGRSWTERSAFSGKIVSAVAVDPVTPAIVYAATAPGGVFKSLDGGQSWTPINSGLRESDLLYVASIAVARSQPSTVYIVAGWTVYASDDGGSTWRGGTEQARFVGVNPTNASRVYVTNATTIKVSTDGARTWRTTATRPTTGLIQIGPIVVTPARPTEVYVGIDQGVLRSRDAGDTWDELRIGPSGGAHSVAIDRMDPGDVWTAQSSIFRMAEGASSFSLMENRLAYVGAVSADGGTLLAAVPGASSGFVTAFDPSGTMLWSTFLGGRSSDYATSVSAQAGSIHVTGVTFSELWPLAQAGPRPFGGAPDLYVARYVIRP